MKKLVLCMVLVVTNLSADVGQALTTPGEPVRALGGTGYVIVTQSTPENKKKCLAKDACYDRCAANAQKAGSQIMCSSKATKLCPFGPQRVGPQQVGSQQVGSQQAKEINKLLCLCYQACDETANYETPYKDSTDLLLTRLNGFEGACSTIQNCLTYYTEKLGWPFQCANIFCAYIDPTDGERRSVALEVQDFKKDKDQVPEEFQQMGSEY